MSQVATDRTQGIRSMVALKAPCIVAALTDITLSGEQTVNGVAVTEGRRVLAVAQDDARFNGPWLVATGAWTRPPDFKQTEDVVEGCTVRVTRGATGAGWYVLTTQDPVLGTDDLTFERDLALDFASTDSPEFIGDPQTPDQPDGDADQSVANTLFVTNAIATAIALLIQNALNGDDEFAANLFATKEEIWAGTATDKLISPGVMMEALKEVSVADAATITIDLTTGINFNITPSLGGNRILAFATIPAALVGRTGRIRVPQDGTGSRTLDTSASPMKGVNGQDLVMSTGANSADYVYYDCRATNIVLLSMARNVG